MRQEAYWAIQTAWASETLAESQAFLTGTNIANAQPATSESNEQEHGDVPVATGNWAWEPWHIQSRISINQPSWIKHLFNLLWSVIISRVAWEMDFSCCPSEPLNWDTHKLGYLFSYHALTMHVKSYHTNGRSVTSTNTSMCHIPIP